MYTMVKVREDARDDHDEGHVSWKSPRSPLVGLKALEFLSIHNYRSSEAKSYGHAEEQCPVVFAECMARIPNGNISNGTTGTSILSKGKDTVSNEEKAQIRASSVPRPRAILSSPDNDAAIGKKNRNATAQSSALRNQNKLQARNAHQQLMDKTKKDVDIDAHLKRTVSVETVNINGPGSKRKPKAPSDIKSKHPTQSQQDVLLTKARPYLRAGKPNAARFLV